MGVSLVELRGRENPRFPGRVKLSRSSASLAGLAFERCAACLDGSAASAAAAEGEGKCTPPNDQLYAHLVGTFVSELENASISDTVDKVQDGGAGGGSADSDDDSNSDTPHDT